MKIHKLKINISKNKMKKLENFKAVRKKTTEL